MIPAAWGRTAAAGTDAREIAERAADLWRDTAAVLVPIIGDTGVAALYRHATCLARVDHPCLRSAVGAAPASNQIAGLRSALGTVSDDEAADAAQALMQTTQNLLAQLIGDPLAERLLQSAWNNAAQAEAVKEATAGKPPEAHPIAPAPTAQA